jgi:hypothetical protein
LTVPGAAVAIHFDLRGRATIVGHAPGGPG